MRYSHWAFFILCAIFIVRYSQCALIKLCVIHIVRYLHCSFFILCNLQIVRYLNCALLTLCDFHNVRVSQCALFPMCNIHNPNFKTANNLTHQSRQRYRYIIWLWIHLPDENTADRSKTTPKGKFDHQKTPFLTHFTLSHTLQYIYICVLDSRVWASQLRQGVHQELASKSTSPNAHR